MSASLLSAAILSAGMSITAFAEESPKEIKPDAPCATAACHAGILEMKVLHAPTAANQCAACHNPKGNRHEFTLAGQGAALCAGCHEPLEKKKVFHKPAAEGCTTCHNPHGGETKALLVCEESKLCIRCHGHMHLAKEIAEGKSSHSIALEGKGCLTCHQPHASDHIALLNAEYPAAFRAPFAPKSYALCFQCHSQALETEFETTGATNFRNGTRNLHALHVNNKESGLSCRACHVPHAADQPHLLRDSVPAGPAGWSATLHFQETKTGGACALGCHLLSAYDRERPVKEK